MGKALSESVMNSVDAGATRVDINVSSTEYTIVDDGSGFLSREEIYAWFETLGFPHDEGNHRIYGKFGLGRAQQWAYASNVWHSNEFLMHVDVQTKGLDYVLQETEARQGTSIFGKFYKALSDAELLQLEAELERLVRYVPGAVYLNAKLITKDPATEAWDLETNEAYYRFDPKGYSLDVYNGGVLVNHFGRYRFSCAGEVVTKPDFTLSLNVARNDIMSSCPVWPRIAKHFPATVAKEKDKPKVRKDTEEELKEVANAVKAGTKPLFSALENHPQLVTSVLGRGIKYFDLVSDWRAPVVLFAPKGDELGKRIVKLRKGTAVSLDTLKLWGFTEPSQLKAVFAESLKVQDPSRLARFENNVWTADGRATFPSLVSNRIVLAHSELEPAEKAAQTAFKTSTIYLAKDLASLVESRGLALSKGALHLEFGDAPDHLAWLGDDGSLVLRRKEATKAAEGGLAKVISYLMQALRDALAEPLGERVDEILLALVTQTSAVGEFAETAAARYVYECKKKDLPLPQRKLADLAKLGIE
nr:MULTISPECIES: ATP-binding protein [unclassified Variovorax]